jgi:hypothetical protein
MNLKRCGRGGSGLIWVTIPESSAIGAHRGNPKWNRFPDLNFNLELLKSYLHWRLEALLSVDVHTFACLKHVWDRFCCLVLWVPSYRSRVPEFDSGRYQIFWEVVDLEQGPLRVVSITEELRVWETEFNGRGDPLHWPRPTIYPQKLALHSPISGGLSVGILGLLSHGVSESTSQLS